MLQQVVMKTYRGKYPGYVGFISTIIPCRQDKNVPLDVMLFGIDYRNKAPLQ